MRHPLELSFHQLRRECNFEDYTFQSTEEVPESQKIVGQERAEEAMEFGLGIDSDRYHIYVSGANESGKIDYVKMMIEKTVYKKPLPNDWCYVYCFERPEKAVGLPLPPGRGREFQEDMEEALGEIVKQISKILTSEEYDRKRTEITKIYQDEKNQLITELSDFAKEKKYMIKSTSTGFVFQPMNDKRELTDEEYDALDEAEKDQLEVSLQEIQEAAMEVVVRIKNMEKLAQKKLTQLEIQLGLYIISPIMERLTEAYEECEQVKAYLKDLESDITRNLFKLVAEDEELIYSKKLLETEGHFKKYQVNLLIDNSEQENAPFIIEYNPTLNRLTGTIEYFTSNGVLKSSHLNIKPGAIHRANGGYLILEAKKLLTHAYGWEMLKRILLTKEITIESMSAQLGIVEAFAIKPDPIPIDIKVILIGSDEIYHLLYEADEDFSKLFKVLVDFSHEMERSPENEYGVLQFINDYIKNEKIRPLDRPSACALIEYSSLLAGSQKKISTRLGKLKEIIIEANFWAARDESPSITRRHLNKAIEHKHYREGKHEEMLMEKFKDQKILIDVKGQKIGVINGLSVLTIGDTAFGRPNVITVTSSLGQEGVVNIEREAHLSGNLYNKGVLIITGFLLEKFAQKKALSLSARICFEQSYGGIEGDSASCAELVALFSSLSGIPVRQYLAMTGSVNQKGFVQPVGGVTEKIEGFFQICSQRGLTGKQGVIIPYQNLDNLILSEKIVEAVKTEWFHIYAIQHLNEALELMLGEAQEQIYARIDTKLEYYHRMAAKSQS